MNYLDKYSNLIDSTELADLSKEQYKLRLLKLTKIAGHDIDWVIKNCSSTMKLMSEKGVKSAETQRSLINAVLALFKYDNTLKIKQIKDYECWSKHFKKVSAITEHKYDTLQASDKQLETYVPWGEIIKRRDTLDTGSQEYLLLCMYTMIPPARADMNMVKILTRAPKSKDTLNYLVVTKSKMTLVYNEFKSKSDYYKAYEKVLPKDLESIVRKSLENNPREYLIVSPRNNEPYYKPNSFTKYFHRILYDLFGKKVTINTLRHSFITSLDWTNLRPIDKKQLAKDLMHSPSSMERYRFMVKTRCKSGDCKTVAI